MTLTLQKHERLVMKDVEALVAAAGGVCRLVAGAHNKLIITIKGASRSTPISSSPRDRDNFAKQKLCDVRRIIRELS